RNLRREYRSHGELRREMAEYIAKSRVKWTEQQGAWSLDEALYGLQYYFNIHQGVEEPPSWKAQHTSLRALRFRDIVFSIIM
ncbi:unnamed protein product, partial [Chrysoparadoxa australica]